MATFKLYRSGNYLIKEQDGKTLDYSCVDSFMTERYDKFTVQDENQRVSFEIQYVDAINIQDDEGVFYTTETLRTFFRENTADLDGEGASSGSTPEQNKVDISKNDLGYDAWGRAKAVNDNSIFHGMFTRNIPVSTWYETIKDVVQQQPSNCSSLHGALEVTAGTNVGDYTYLRSYRHPRYEPNRGAIYSTAGWIKNPTAGMQREWGTFNKENGVFFRLTKNGLVGVIRTTDKNGTNDYEFQLTIPEGVDLTKGNVFDIQYQWRGVGNYKWFINLQEVGNTEYLGTLEKLSISNPALPVAFRSQNLGELAENEEMWFGCVDVSSEGGKDNGKTYGSFGISSNTGEANFTGYNQPLIAVRSKETISGLLNTRDTLALLNSFYADEKCICRIWKTRDFTAITDGNSSWVDIGDGHLEGIELAGTGGTLAFDKAKAELMFTCRVAKERTYSTSALFEGRTEIYLTPGDMFVFTMHRETGGATKGGTTFEFAEQI